MQEKRSSWASNLGFILAAAGSAVGIGNIWKFPGKVGANDGGTFIVVYMLIIAIIGFSLLMAEICIGRHSQSNPITAFTKINKRWSFVGVLGAITSFIILAYYSVVGGWILKYVTTYLTGADFGGDTSTYFVNFISEGVEPLIWHAIFMAIIVAIVIKGVSSGIEKLVTTLMPALFLILIIITVRAVTLTGASEGLDFIFHFDASAIDADLIITALGQAFFSLTIGASIMITYGSYVSKKSNLPRSVATIAVLDTAVAIIAGVAIICAIFATDPSLIGSSGGGFAFISLPNVFATMTAGTFFGLLFFVLLLFAAITSAISLMECLVSCTTELLHFSRLKSTVILAILMYALGCLYSLSQGAMPNLTLPWFDFANGLTWEPLGNVLEHLTDNLLMPLTSFFVCIFIGWIWGPKNAAKEIRQGSEFKIAPIWMFSIKYICPIAILAILFTTLILGVTIS